MAGMVISIDTAEHYVWGDVCDGWYLFKRDEMSVTQIAPQVKHQFKNRSDSDVQFLVISVPSTRGDRVNL